MNIILSDQALFPSGFLSNSPEISFLLYLIVKIVVLNKVYHSSKDVFVDSHTDTELPLDKYKIQLYLGLSGFSVVFWVFFEPPSQSLLLLF